MLLPIIIILFNFITGTLCLTYGVNLMSNSLEKAHSTAVKKILASFTGNVFSAFITGTLVTALVQSSTAVTVITVGFVNSGMMRLSQAVGIIYGANIGTTVTAQLISLNPGYIAIPLIISGLALKILLGKRPGGNLASAAVGLGLMFTGISIMSAGVPYIRENRYMYEFFKAYGNNPYTGLLIGMVATALVHSSSATVGMTIVLFNSGLISLEAAVGLTLGDNIGTCITAQLASIGTGVSARRTAWAHTIYNIAGALCVLIFFPWFTQIVRSLTFFAGQNETRLVANIHTIFNLLSAVVFFPVTKYYVRFIEWLIPDS